MSTIFEKIISGDIPSYPVWEDADHYAFLTIEPIQPGHTLVIPKKPIPYLFDMSDPSYQALWSAARTVAKVLRERLHCIKVGVIVEGFGVADHVHIHLVPLYGAGELDLQLAKQVSTDELGPIHHLLTT